MDDFLLVSCLVFLIEKSIVVLRRVRIYLGRGRSVTVLLLLFPSISLLRLTVVVVLMTMIVWETTLITFSLPNAHLVFSFVVSPWVAVSWPLLRPFVSWSRLPTATWLGLGQYSHHIIVGQYGAHFVWPESPRFKDLWVLFRPKLIWPMLPFISFFIFLFIPFNSLFIYFGRC